MFVSHLDSTYGTKFNIIFKSNTLKAFYISPQFLFNNTILVEHNIVHNEITPIKHEITNNNFSLDSYFMIIK